jgi:hypothetical protein
MMVLVKLYNSESLPLLLNYCCNLKRMRSEGGYWEVPEKLLRSPQPGQLHTLFFLVPGSLIDGYITNYLMINNSNYYKYKVRKEGADCTMIPVSIFND